MKMDACSKIWRSGLVVALAGTLAACGSNAVLGRGDGGGDVTNSGDGSATDARDGGGGDVTTEAGPDGSENDVVDAGPADEAPEADAPVADDVVDGAVAETGTEAGPTDDGVDAATGPETGPDDGVTSDAGDESVAPGDGGDAGPGMDGASTGDGATMDSGCATGQTACGTTCVDTQTDPANCGTCGAACSGGQVCAMGTCGCATGQMSCGGACVDTNSSTANCGMCGRACAAGQVCTMGTCGCATGELACGAAGATTCTDPMTDNANCGGCGMACAAGQSCAGGVCTCPTGQTRCGTGATSTCVNTASDNANCGGCGAACTGGSTCSMGACACPTGQTRCGTGATAACTDTATDTANCGACGTACPSGQVCSMGMCRSTCTSPTVPCGTGAAMTCANTQNDDQNCGACGTVCGTVPNSFGGLCTMGACRPICTSGFANCNSTYADGCEVNTTNNVNNCGSCGNTCPASVPNSTAVTCVASVCRPTCPADTATAQQRDCNLMTSDGCETNILNTNAHCGACNNACALGQTCVAGSCTATSCSELHTRAPSLPSGLYSLDPDGTGPIAPFDAFCDMTTDGGGWTLILKADGATTNWAYAAARWTDATTLSPTSLPTVLEDAKYPAYNFLPFASVRLVVRQTTPAPASGFGDQSLRMDFTGTATTMRAIQTATPTDVTVAGGTAGGIAGPAGTAFAVRLASNPRAEWAGLFESAQIQCNCSLRGLNLRTQGVTQGNGTQNFRIGMWGNQENDCQTPDSRIGVGHSGGTVVGSSSTTQYACAGSSTTLGTVTRSGFAWVWVR